jgi:hypothetical protein
MGKKKKKGLSMIILSLITELPRALMHYELKQSSPVLDENIEEANVGVGGILFMFGLVAFLGVAANYLAFFVISQVKIMKLSIFSVFILFFN